MNPKYRNAARPVINHNEPETLLDAQGYGKLTKLDHELIRAAKNESMINETHGPVSQEPFVGRINWFHPSAKDYYTTVGVSTTKSVLPEGTQGSLDYVTENHINQAVHNTAKETEFVLGLPAGNLVTKLLTTTNADLTNEALFLDFHLQRNWCETDQDWLQYLPYIVFYKRNGDNYQIFTYQRGKGVGEGRLAGNYSIGIGGHVNPHDQYDVMANVHKPNENKFLLRHGLANTLLANVYREVEEEIEFIKDGKAIHFEELATVSGDIRSKMTAWLDHSGSDVDRVHLGLMLAIEVPANVDIRTKEDSLVDVGFVDLEELYTSRDNLYPDTIGGSKPLENWSKAIVESLHETQRFQDGGVVDWRIGTLARIFNDKYDLYKANVFMRA